MDAIPGISPYCTRLGRFPRCTRGTVAISVSWKGGAAKLNANCQNPAAQEDPGSRVQWGLKCLAAAKTEKSGLLENVTCSISEIY